MTETGWWLRKRAVTGSEKITLSLPCHLPLDDGSTGMTPEQKIVANAESVVRLFREEMEIELDYDRAGVEYLAGFIDRHRDDWQRDPDLLVNKFGSFLGECIRRQYGGCWNEDLADGQGLTLDAGITVFPFSQVRKQIAGESDGSVMGLFDSLPSRLAAERETGGDAIDP